MAPQPKDEFLVDLLWLSKSDFGVGVNLRLGVWAYLANVLGCRDGLEANLVWHPSLKRSFS